MTAPEWNVVFAGVSLLVLWTGTVIGAAIWIMGKMADLKDQILKRLDADKEKVQAIEMLVIRHDTILNPEFTSGRGRHHRQ
jgi:hypothetical protein